MKIRNVLIIMILPFLAAAQNTVDSLIFISSTAVFFESDSFRLTKKHIEDLDSLLVLKSDEEFSFSVESYTDNIGSNEYNLKLSRKRSQSLIDFLLKKGISNDWISTIDHGELSPLSSNSSDEGRSQNRRVTVRKYRVKKLQWITGTIKDSTSNEGIKANVKLHAKAFEYESKTDSTGQFKLLGPINEVIGIDVRAKGYFLHSQMLRATPNISEKQIDIAVPPIEVGKAMNLDKLFFEGNKDILLPKSLPVLKELELFMKENDEICAEIEGHINKPGRLKVDKNSWDYYLSVARAKKIHDQLISKSAGENRLMYKGYGNWRMLFPNARNEAKASKNRRVEVRIIDCDRVDPTLNGFIPPNLEFSSGVPSRW